MDKWQKMEEKGMTRDEILAAMKIEIEKTAAKQKIKQEKEKQELKAKGYTHLVLAYVHPRNGGDDYQTGAYYIGEPTEKDIAKLLVRSEVKTDYRVEVL